MDDTIIRAIISLALATAIGSNEFNNYLERLNFKEFNEEFKNNDFSELDAFTLEKNMSYNKVINFLPVANIVASLVHYLHRNKLMNDIKFRVKAKMSYMDAIRKRNKELENYRNGPRKYFVGYFEGDKPIVIWFTFNGAVININDDSSPIFNILSDEEKVRKIISIFGDLINGVDGYMHSENINEVLNSHLVRNLIREYKMEKDDFNRSR